MRVIDLFAGIGGFSLGLERAGLEIVMQVEIDDWCCRVLFNHWPDVERWGDIHDVQFIKGTAELVCGGFPCQPVSLPGNRRGEDDDRWLWPEMLRCIRQVQPAYVVVENVPGLVTLGLDEVLSDLEGEGFSCQTFDIPAAGVDAWHLRRRIWIVAYHHGRRCEIIREQKYDPFQRARRDVADRLREERRWDGPPAANAHTAVRPQQGRLDGQSGTDTPVAGDHGEERTDPHPGRQLSQDRAARLWHGRSGAAQQRHVRDDYWEAEPEVGRVVDGFPGRVDQLRSLGNAVVPQLAQHIGELILAHDAGIVAAYEHAERSQSG